MQRSSLVLVCILGVASGHAAPKAKALLATRRAGAPDDDHFVDELHDNAQYKNATTKPKTAMDKDFAAMDLNGDKKLSVQELMYRQYVTGCEPMEAQVRARDYMACGDVNKDKVISYEEFTFAATKPNWAECIKGTSDRRAHGFVRFFDADQNMDGFLTKQELQVGMIKLWGEPGMALVDDVMKCTDKDKDGKMSQTEFHDAIATYNPMTRTWQMWSGTSDKAILKCMEPAFKKFDAALVFEVTDTNHDNQISPSESYATMSAVNGNHMMSATADAIFKAADKDKNGYLNQAEFEGAGEAYKGPAGTNTTAGFHLGGRAAWPTDTYNEGYGMSVACHNNLGESWRVFSDDMGKVKVTPKKPWTGNVTVKQR